MNYYSKNMQEGEMLCLERFHISFKNSRLLEAHQGQNSTEGVCCKVLGVVQLVIGI